MVDSEIRQVGHSHDSQGKASLVGSRRAKTAFFCMADVWRIMLVDLQGPNGAAFDYDRFLELSKHPPQVSRERKDGRDCIRVDTVYDLHDTGPEIKHTTWHDVGHNYLVWKARQTIAKSSDPTEQEVVEFAEFPGGVVVPTRCERRTYRGGKVRNREEARLTEIDVNRPIPGDVFRLPPIPARTLVTDEIQGAQYPVDPDWQRIGPSTPYQKATKPASLEDAPSPDQAQSTEEPRSWLRWLLPASLALLAACAAYLLYRRYSARVASRPQPR